MSTWFITGASRGFGAELVQVALDNGQNVIAAARNRQHITDRFGEIDNLLAISLDVTHSAAIPAAVQAGLDKFGGIDVLINNAGRGFLGAIEEISDEESRSLFDLNFFAVLEMTRAVLPSMRAQKSGKIVNISSTSGLRGVAGTGLYNATKFALEGVSEALKGELAEFGVQVMIVEPGVFRTDFLDSSSLSRPAAEMSEYNGTAAHATLAWGTDNNHLQAGDPVKGAALIFAVANSPVLPMRLPLGRDAVDVIEARAKRNVDELVPFRAASIATAHD